ncbi:MAG: Ni/Fe hydrogenase, partial [Gammaproteobacteria bacterium]|nr:Ni/Fe hydrogenase [Gammaproteobacteria bacterium]
IQSGHGCIGCSEPGFWDAGSLYKPVSASPSDLSSVVAPALAAGAAAGIAVGLANRMKKARAAKQHQKVTNDDLHS